MNAYWLESPELLAVYLASQGREIVAVQRDDDGAARWLGVSDVGAYRFDPSMPLPQSPPKSFFFPEREPLFRFDGRRFAPVVPELEPRVLFGVRSCDAEGIAYLDRFFAGDAWYRARRERTLVVAADCTASCAGGFCAAVDSGPDVRPDAADLVLHADGGSWLLLTASAAGEAAISALTLSEADEKWMMRRIARAARVAAGLYEGWPVAAAARVIDEGRVDDETWESLGLRCFACSACTQLCPTCSCFTTFDATDEGDAAGAVAFERHRAYDSCLFEAFQREASGHNPSASPGDRVARFWQHKLSREFVARQGRIGCVGCGRCERACLGVIGVHSVSRRLAEDVG